MNHSKNPDQRPFFSIIMPAYNSEKYIAKSIDSVVQQSYVDWELIIINDQSTDDTLQIIESYANSDKRIRNLSTKENSGGPGHPRDIGINVAKGSYISFLDSDDIFHQNKLKEHYHTIQRSDADWVYSTSNIIDEEGSFLKYNSKPWFQLMYEKILPIKWVVILTNPFCLSSISIRKSIIQEHAFSKNPNVFRAVEDWYNWIRIHHELEPRMKFINQALIDYRWVENSISLRKNHRCEYEAIVAFSYLMKDDIIGLPKWIIGCSMRLIRIFFVKILKYKVV